MDYNLIINGKTIPVAMDIIDEKQMEITIQDNHYIVNYTRIDANRLHLEVDGRSCSVYVADQPDGRQVFLNGNTYFVQDEDILAQSGAKKSSNEQSADEITPPMPAVVVAVKVAAGDAMEKGQPVVVVSAMKMETTLYAPYDGTVTTVNVADGDKVMPGDILVDIEKSAQDADTD